MSLRCELVSVVLPNASIGNPKRRGKRKEKIALCDRSIACLYNIVLHDWLRDCFVRMGSVRFRGDEANQAATADDW